MNFSRSAIVASLLAVSCLAACGPHPTQSVQENTAPAPTSASAASPHSAGAAPRAPAALSNTPRLFTMADDNQTVTLTVGEHFALELGPSGGSPWVIDFSDPSALEPAIRQISAAGNRVLFQPIKTGTVRIDANSHIPCTGHGFCPEAATFFSLNLQVQPPQD